MDRLIELTFAGAAMATIAASVIPARAEVLSYKVELKGSSEVPPNQSKATGNVSVSYDPAEKKLSWTGNYSGLTGPVTVAHFHGPALAGKNAGIAVAISSGNLPASFEGSATLTDAQAADLAAGRWYLNLHTAAYPAGEIRGQVVK
jgi:CHRD domain-containing protein